ncbi:disulfide bond formation protein B [Wenxinia marina]|uniref:Disulfide bond formation protein DsbB n=1 Tax=Wenxinia marina DSM 24838 TaxID=1123501 RepID=A0A0D0Q2I5_9RHOB|nr:disulfide bond formation protein B [Wenxinia marina]KIQ68734.1 Disulfide bond formation protein DsbB [Wenxinia marina DSM 24838]GGL65565.1 dihydroneopterin aldolase [Wenxinia marina]
MRSPLILLATLGSVALLGGAFLFQSLGWQPCAMCLWQRWPHAAAIAIGVIALATGWRGLAWLGALAAATTTGIAIFHTGVERGWWEGPASCTGVGPGLGGDLLSTDGPAPVLCDVFTPFLWGLSMANWNAILSALLVVVWVAAARAKG